MSNGLTLVSPTRTRTASWQDPVAAFERGRLLSGLDHLLAMKRGEIPPPPIMATLGFELVDAEECRAVFECEPGEHLYNPIGSVHGGFAATLLDSATGCAVQTTLAPGVGYTTLDLHVTYVRAITRDTGRIRAEGRVLHAGRRVATAEGRLIDSGDRLLAHATASCVILQPEPGDRA
jgi:uncharacterized protein (TIGR00369 family)